MNRPVRSQLMLIILLFALQSLSFNINVLVAAHEYSVEERIRIDELYVEGDENGYYTRVNRFTTAKLSSALEHALATDAGGGGVGGGGFPYQHTQEQEQQHHLQHQHAAKNKAEEQQLQANAHNHQYFMQQQQQVQTHKAHYPNSLQGQHNQQQQQPLPIHQQEHHQPHLHQQLQQNQPQQVSQQYHQHHKIRPQDQQHQHHRQLHSHQLQLQYLYEQPHQLVQSHIYQHTQIEWRSESKHDGSEFSGFLMHNFETTYPIVGDSSQHHHASSCEPIGESSILMMPGDLKESTCEATSASSFGAPGAPDHVPKFARHHHHHTNKPSRNSNVESYPLAPQHYHYESSLMTAIRHYWREISGLCLASAIFLNWLFVVVKRRFIASGFTRHIADVALGEPVDETVQRSSFSSSTTSAAPKLLSKDTANTCNNSAHDSAFEENASPVSLDDVSTSQSGSSLSSRPRSISSSPYGHSTSQPSSSLNSSSYTSDYISRYSSDFDSIRRLGRGGFGIVFEAKNKIDDCHYAVKRICLPLEKEARERVMREVRALAKLDHAGIVRYYNAWLETPPDEWLKQHDAQLGIFHTRDGLCFPSTDGIYDKNGLNLNTKGDTSDKFGESGDISNSDFGNNRSPFSNKHRSNGYSSIYLKENSSSPSLDIVFEGSGSIRLEAENNENTEESDIKVESELHLEKVYLYIQMQLCRKDTLKDWLRTNCENRDKTTIFDFFYQIVDAVEYVHSQDLIHRDLKPSNIFFSLDGTLKIGDFGLCRAKTNSCVGSSLDLKEYVADFSDAVHTEQVGTQLYMSPEQMNGLSYNHKVDIFAMGLILLELLVPFKTQMQRVNVLLKARNNMFSREFKKEHPDEHELVRSLLDRRPHKRPTATAIKQHDLLANAQLSQPVIERIYHRRRTISSNSSTE